MKKQIAAQPPAAGKPPEMMFSRATDNTLLMRLAGNWRIDQPMPSIAELEKQLKSEPGVKNITFDLFLDWGGARITAGNDARFNLGVKLKIFKTH